MQAYFIQFHFGPGESVGTTIEGTSLGAVTAHIHKELRNMGFFEVGCHGGVASINAATLKYFTVVPVDPSDQPTMGFDIRTGIK